MGEFVMIRATDMVREENSRRHWLFASLCLALIVMIAVTAAFAKCGLAMTVKERVLRCPCEGAAVAHIHNDDCYGLNGILVCPLAELEPHTHGDECYAEESSLICGLAESAGHVHGDACRTMVRGELVCADESEEHEHGDGCYEWREELTCGLAEGEGAHAHTAACYETDRVLICGKEEFTGETHTHGAACFETVELTGEEIAQMLADAARAEAENAKQTEDDMPAQCFEGSTENVTVTVEAAAGVLPAGVTMVVYDVIDEEIIDAVVGAVEGRAKSVQAVNIAFYGADGAEITPEGEISVTMTSDLIDAAREPVMVRLHSGAAEIVARGEAF